MAYTVVWADLAQALEQVTGCAVLRSRPLFGREDLALPAVMLALDEVPLAPQGRAGQPAAVNALTWRVGVLGGTEPDLLALLQKVVAWADARPNLPHGATVKRREAALREPNDLNLDALEHACSVLVTTTW